MSQYDEINAKQALTWRLREWGVEGADKKADGFIRDLIAAGWIMNPQREARPTPPKSSQACWTCGKVYRLGIADDGRTDSCCDDPQRRPEHGADPAPYVEQIRKAIR